MIKDSQRQYMLSAYGKQGAATEAHSDIWCEKQSKTKPKKNDHIFNNAAILSENENIKASTVQHGALSFLCL